MKQKGSSFRKKAQKPSVPSAVTQPNGTDENYLINTAKSAAYFFLNSLNSFLNTDKIAASVA